MSRLNLQNDLFLGLQELNRLIKFLKDDGYLRIFLSAINNFGIVKVKSDTNFSNFKVTNGSANGTIQIAQDSYAIDQDMNIIFQEAINDVAVTSDSNWYWVKISHQETNKEIGTINVSANGDITGIGTSFTETLRDQNSYPIKINFPDSVINTGDYQVVSVLSDTQAIISGSLIGENGLDYITVGSFTPGISPAGSTRLPYFYDDCLIELVLETVLNTPPAKTSGEEFYIARVRNTGIPAADIEDKRTEWFSAGGEVEGWTQPSLEVNFTNVGSREVEYRKNYLGDVEIRGAFNTTVATGTIFTLPEELWPPYIIQGIYGTNDAASIKTIIVNTDGTVESGLTTDNDYDTSNPNIIINLKFQLI
jgi:hypothetical protein